MKQTNLVMILAFFTLMTDAKSIKTCEENAMCKKGECCARGVCVRFIPVGKRCNPMAQIMRVQCPCAVGSSCVLTNTLNLGEEMSCRNIENQKFQEVVENRDWKHIEGNNIGNE